MKSARLRLCHSRILNAVFSLMPDRPHLELICVDAKSGFGLDEMDISE